MNTESGERVPPGWESGIVGIVSKIERGERVLGTVVNSTDPMTTEILAAAGYDFLWIDMEHTANGKIEVDRHIAAARSLGAAPFVRLPWNDPVLAKPILEMGPAAVVFPFVNTADEAARAVAACRYPPAGVRGFGPARANGFGSVALAEYLTRAGCEPWVVLQIEHVDAVRNLERICEVPGVGSLLVGPFDLSASIGKPGEVGDPEVTALMDRIAEIAMTREVTFGAFAISTDDESIRRWIERGASWLALDTDSMLLTRCARHALSAVRSHMVQ